MIAARLRGCQRPLRVLACIVFASLATSWAVAQMLGQHERMHYERREVARLTRAMKTICIGRFLLEMPRETRVEIGPARIDGFDISVREESAEDFRRRLAARETRVGGQPGRHGGVGNLASVEEVAGGDGVTGKILVHGRNAPAASAANDRAWERGGHQQPGLEALVHVDRVSIDLHASANDPGQTHKLARLVTQLAPNSENRIPMAPGYCIGRAFVRDPLRPDQGEQITMSARLPSLPDVRIKMVLAAGRQPGQQGLIDRKAASTSRMQFGQRLHFRTLRAAPRELGGLLGEEVVHAVTEDHAARIHSFWWEVDGAGDDVSIPHIVFEMTTGNGKHGPASSSSFSSSSSSSSLSLSLSLSDAAGLDLWDGIVSSIRLRPTLERYKSRHGQFI